MPVDPDRKARILVVDDERTNRQLLEILLEAEGYSLAMAASGEEALVAVARDRPDLVLLDVIMPDMDGYEVATRLKADPTTRNIPIIMVSSLDDSRARVLGLTAGAEDFLGKPIDRAELRVRVRNLLRLKAFSDSQGRYSDMLETEVGSRTAELVDSERLYRSTFDAAPVGIAHVDRGGRWLRVNQRLCELLGYPREVLLGPDAPALLHARGSASQQEALRRMAAGEQDRHVLDEEPFRRQDGSVVWMRVNLSVHRDTVGSFQHFIAVFEDITERRSLEARVRQASKMDAIGRLASGVAHDFNNLLSVVIGYSEMLVEDVPEGDPMRADLEAIQEAAQRGVRLTGQLLAFSREQVLQPTNVNLAELVDGLRGLLGRLLGEGVELRVTGPATMEGVMADPGQLERVIMNLVVNARDAMPGGGRLTIETSVVDLDEAHAATHVGVSAGRYVMLAVTDTGGGMDQATQARMFEPFFTTKEPGKGTGLGLATVFGIVQQSGGSITVNSEIDEGTTFKIYLPTVEAAPVAPAPAPADAAVLGGSETVLVVEDQDDVRAVAMTILRRYGYQVLEARGGAEAILLCQRHPHPIDLLLTDVVMPRMSGWQLAENLLQRQPDLKVLYMSGHMEDAIVRDKLAGTDFAVMRKPMTPTTLARKVRETLDAPVPAARVPELV